MKKHVGANLFINDNTIEILDYLNDNELMPKSYNKSFVLSRLIDRDFELILFNPSNSESPFLHFQFVDFIESYESLQYIAQTFHDFALKNYAVYMPARKKMEEVIYMLPTYRALFGYKANEKSEYFT